MKEEPFKKSFEKDINFENAIFSPHNEGLSLYVYKGQVRMHIENF